MHCKVLEKTGNLRTVAQSDRACPIRLRIFVTGVPLLSAQVIIGGGSAGGGGGAGAGTSTAAAPAAEAEKEEEKAESEEEDEDMGFSLFD